MHAGANHTATPAVRKVLQTKRSDAAPRRNRNKANVITAAKNHARQA